MSKTKDYLDIGRYRIPYHEYHDKNGNIYYRARLTKTVLPDGKRKEKDVRAPTLDELKIKLEKIIQPYLYLYSSEGSIILFDVAANEWFQTESTYWDSKTKKTYRAHLDNYILPLTRGLKLADIDYVFLQNTFINLKNAGVSPQVQHQLRSRFNSIFSFCIKRRYLASNPCEGVTVEKPVILPQNSLSVNQQKRLLALYQRFPEEEGIVATQLFTGGRISEVLGLSWDKLDWESGILKYDCELEREGINNQSVFRIKPCTKTRRSRQIVLTSTALFYFRKQWEWQQKMKYIAGSSWHCSVLNLKGDLIFSDTSGGPILYGTYERHLKRNLSILGMDMKDFHSHSLRHTAATNHFHAKRDIVATANFLGHASLYNTLLYTHSTYDDMKEVAKIIDQTHNYINPYNNIISEV